MSIFQALRVSTDKVYFSMDIFAGQTTTMNASELAHLFMQAPVAICIVSGPEYTVELVNERMLQFLGRTAAIVGHPLQQTLTEVREQGLLAILDKVRTSGQSSYISNFPAVILINGVREPRYFNLVFKPYCISQGETVPSGIFCVAHNVTEAVLAHQKLEEEKQRTTLALETGGLGILATDWDSNTVTADQRVKEIFGLEGSQPLEAYISRIHPDDRKLRETAIQDGIANGSFDFEARLLFPDGRIRWVRSRGMVQKNSEGKLTGSFGVVQDITAQKQYALALRQEVAQRTSELQVANKTLKQVNEDLMRSNTNLEEFARAASHDLKEPVRKMQVFASRLKETLATRLDENEKDVFSRMEKAAERMALLVDDLLEYSHVGGGEVREEAVDLNEKLARILIDLELMIAEKGATVNVGPLPTVKGQRLRLQQAFQNLLTNALKYSRPGVAPHITVTASIIPADDLEVQLPVKGEQRFHKIQVADNGIGFHPDDAEKIFHVFTRLHGKDEYAGTGIGLAIAKKVIESQGGYIYATGELGEGACFTVLMPVV